MTLLSKLEITPQRSDMVLLFGLPSNLEKWFARIPYAKGMSVLIKKKKIDYCMLFAISKQKAKETMEELLPYLKADCVLWIAFPKKTSKIATNLDWQSDWYFTQDAGYYKVVRLVLDNVWESLRFMKIDSRKIRNCELAMERSSIVKYCSERRSVPTIHSDLESAFEEYPLAYEFFKSLPNHSKNIYLTWIHTVEKDIVFQKRIQEAIQYMSKGVLNPYFYP